ncbi:MAG: FIST C-terminal domain-containing protein [Actinomycetota bacterium]|nr:FIST C-terminal domain-containing protein [Actinomycetota bacterium]
MATRAGVGTSRHHNPNVAGREAAEQALQRADVERPDFVFMFATVGYDQHSVLRAVRETTGGAPLCGCSGEGTIGGNDADESNYSVVVMAISSEELRWTNGLATGLSTDSRAAGQLISQSVSSDLSADAVGLFVFPDGTTVNFDEFFAGLDGELPSDRFLPIWGGGAGDNLALVQTYQYCDDEVVSDGVAYALLSGKAQPASTIGIGYLPIGGERKVTRSQGNVIYEIDGKSAVEVLQEYLPYSALAEDWRRYAHSCVLCLRAPSYMEDEEYVVRTILSLDATDGSATVQTEVPEGTSVWMTSKDQEKFTAGLDRMAEQIKKGLGGNQPKLVFHFDCVSRGKLMFRDQEKMRLLRQLRQAIDPEAPWAGFYTFGEIGPVNKHNCYHNYTGVVLALG